MITPTRDEIMARINASETPKSIIVVEVIDELLGIIERLQEDVALLKRPQK